MKQSIFDAVGIFGIGFIAYGSWLIYKPAGFIVGGLLLVGVAFIASRGPIA